jgi:two-component system LytT family response regulator
MFITTTVYSPVLLLPTDRGTKVIPLESIVRIEAMSNYCKLIFSDGKTLVVARVLRWFEKTLSAGDFVRIHHKHLVNGRWCRGVSGLQVSLSSGETLPVARRRAKVLKEAAGLFSIKQ